MKTEIAKQSQKERKQDQLTNPAIRKPHTDFFGNPMQPGTLLARVTPAKQDKIIELTKDMLVRYDGYVYKVDTDITDDWSGHSFLGEDCTEKNCDDPDCGKQSLTIHFIEVPASAAKAAKAAKAGK